MDDGELADPKPNWAELRYFKVRPSDLEDEGFNVLLLKILRRLDAAYPERVDLTDCRKIQANLNHLRSFWRFFCKQGIVTGSLNDASISDSGRFLFDQCLRYSPEIAEALTNKVHGPTEGQASYMMRDILRRQFASRT